MRARRGDPGSGQRLAVHQHQGLERVGLAVRRWRGLASEVGRPARSRPRQRAQTQRLQAG